MIRTVPPRLRLLLPLAAAAALVSTGARTPGQEADAGMSRGVALLEQFRFSDAAAEFERVVALRPESAAAHVNLGIAWFNERDFAAARASFARALDLEPGGLHATYNLGLIEKLEGNTEAALTAFRRVAEADPDDAMTQYYLGAAYAAAGRLEEAETALRTAIGLQPEHESAHFSLGNVLVRAGRREEGRAQLMRFQELKNSLSGGGVSAGLQYTELGPYAEAVETRPAPLHGVQNEPAVTGQLRFAETTSDWNLALPPAPAPPDPPGTLRTEDYSADWVAENLLPQFGSGVAIRDLNADGRPEVLFVRNGTVLVFRNTGDGFEAWEDSGIETDGAVSVTVGDVDLDGDPDVYVAGVGPNALFLNRSGEGGPTFRLSAASGAEDGDLSVGATLADFDHDGDLDIQVSNYAPVSLAAFDSLPEVLRVPDDLPGAPNRLYRNNGDGSFTDVAAETRTDGAARRSLFSVFSDWDDDRDVDFLVVNDGSPVQVFSNDRIGTFTESSASWGVETATRMRGAAAADYDRDGFFDLLLSAEGSALNMLLRGSGPGGFSPDIGSPFLLRAGVPGARYGVSFLDADHDMDLDLLMVTSGADGPLSVYENSPGGFARAGVVGAGLESGEAPRALATGDLDGDGDLDAVIGTTRGRVLAFRNEQTGAGNWLAVRPRGLRSNLDGVGAKIEVRVSGVSQRRQVRTTSGYLSQSDLPVHFGLGEALAADYVRFLWPGGVKQVELDVPALAVASVEELNRKGTSCPVLYAWDGQRIRFVTDFLGGSALGNLLAPATYNFPDTAEVVKMEAFPLAPRDGAYEMRWVNQLEEVIFYDRAALWVVDHPEDVDVFPRERLMPGPPYPAPGLIAVRNRRAPSRASSATAAGTKEVTAELARVDRNYVDDFALLPFKGYAEPHDLTLTFEGVRAGVPQVLLLYGWVDYADSSSNLAASQAGVQAQPPILEIADGDGFRIAAPRMGFPAGLPKTMVVPLTDVAVESGRPLRIRTNMRIYWDRIELAEAADAPLQEWRLDAETAELGFAGYPAPHRPRAIPPTEYRYETRAPRDIWGAHEGNYTRFGDVLPLLDAIDDRYVIARHGDELSLRFDARQVPAPAPGTRRSFFAFADGFGKDMDLNSARPHTIEPLPFHGMPSYPYPEGAYPDSEALERWRAEYNTRRIGPEGRYGFLTDTEAPAGTTGTSSPAAGARRERQR